MNQLSQIIIGLVIACVALTFYSEYMIDCDAATPMLPPVTFDEEGNEIPMDDPTSLGMAGGPPLTGKCSAKWIKFREGLAFLAFMSAIVLLMYGIMTGQFTFFLKTNSPNGLRR